MSKSFNVNFNFSGPVVLEKIFKSIFPESTQVKTLLPIVAPPHP
jgi:hypothetical protein